MIEKHNNVNKSTFYTDDDYWDCECEFDYIHKKSETTHCQKCDTCADEQPDSRVDEIKEHYPDYLPWMTFYGNWPRKEV